MAHGASLRKGVDAIGTAAAFVEQVQNEVTREMPADDGAVVTVDTVYGGEPTNIVCPSVSMTGTITTRIPGSRALSAQRVG